VNNSAAKYIKDHCKEEMRCIWQGDPAFNKIALQVIEPGNFLRLAKHGSNNYFKA
jgi:hypothetical protein